MIDSIRLRSLVGDAAPLDRWLEPFHRHLAATDYPAGEALARQTRARLERLESAAPRRVALDTRSALVLRDADLLTRLDAHHAVSVAVHLSALDPALSRRLEGQGDAPAARLEAAAELAGRGLSVTVVLSPLLPGINDGREQLRELLAAAGRAGARDVAAESWPVSPWVRRRLLARLAAEVPHLAPLYRHLYTATGRVRQEEEHRLAERFERFRLAAGFPREWVGRG